MPSLPLIASCTFVIGWQHAMFAASVLTLNPIVCRTSPRMMYWLTDIILKDLKLGFAEATVLEALHPVC